MTREHRPSVVPQDVVRAADFVVDALTPAIGLDWSVPAGRLEWGVDYTISHMTGAPAKYALYLASRSTRFMAVQADGWPDASQAERIDAIGLVGRALANIAAESPPVARGFHSNGMADAEGFVAMACEELLVHGHDVAQGLGLTFEPPEDLCRAIVARLFPWLVDDDRPPWEAILWQTGRIDIPGRATNDDDTWPALTIPLSEWDGEIPVDDPRPIVEWVRTDGEGTWQPRYLEQ